MAGADSGTKLLTSWWPGSRKRENTFTTKPFLSSPLSYESINGLIIHEVRALMIQSWTSQRS
jgi:hypothetical protein